MKAPDAPADALYLAARVHAVAAARVRADDRERHAARAVALLRQAVRGGSADAAEMSRDRDLAPLRDRPDFRAVLAELAAKDSPREPAPPPRPAK